MEVYSLFLSRIQWANCAGIEETEEVCYFFHWIYPSVLQGKSQKRPRLCHFWHLPRQCPVWYPVGDCYPFLLQLHSRMWASLHFVLLLMQEKPDDIAFPVAQPSNRESDVSWSGHRSICALTASPHGQCGPNKGWWDQTNRLCRQPELSGN